MADLTSAVLWDSFCLCRYPYRSRKPCTHIRHHYSHQPCHISEHLHCCHCKQRIFGNEAAFVRQTQQQPIPTWALINAVRSICCSLHETGRSAGRCGLLCLCNALEDGLNCVMKSLDWNDHPERKKSCFSVILRMCSITSVCNASFQTMGCGKMKGNFLLCISFGSVYERKCLCQVLACKLHICL